MLHVRYYCVLWSLGRWKDPEKHTCFSRDKRIPRCRCWLVEMFAKCLDILLPAKIFHEWQEFSFNYKYFHSISISTWVATSHGSLPRSPGWEVSIRESEGLAKVIYPHGRITHNWEQTSAGRAHRAIIKGSLKKVKIKSTGKYTERIP